MSTSTDAACAYSGEDFAACGCKPFPSRRPDGGCPPIFAGPAYYDAEFVGPAAGSIRVHSAHLARAFGVLTRPVRLCNGRLRVVITHLVDGGAAGVYEATPLDGGWLGFTRIREIDDDWVFPTPEEFDGRDPLTENDGPFVLGRWSRRTEAGVQFVVRTLNDCLEASADDLLYPDPDPNLTTQDLDTIECNSTGCVLEAPRWNQVLREPSVGSVLFRAFDGGVLWTRGLCDGKTDGGRCMKETHLAGDVPIEIEVNAEGDSVAGVVRTLDPGSGTTVATLALPTCVARLMVDDDHSWRTSDGAFLIDLRGVSGECRHKVGYVSLRADGGLQFVNARPPADVWSAPLKRRRGPDGTWLDIHIVGSLGEHIQRVRRRDARLMPIDQEWIDLTPHFPPPEEMGSIFFYDAKWDGSAWILVVQAGDTLASRKMYYLRFTIE